MTSFIEDDMAKKVIDKKNRGHLLTLLLAIIALVMALFVLLQLRFSERNFSFDARNVARSVSQLRQQTQSLHLDVVHLQSSTSELHQQVQQQLALLPTNADRAAWTLAEVDYLLRLANYQLIYSQNVATASVLLQAADKHLAGLSDPNLNRIRILLAQALADLQAVPKVDVAGLLARIHVLQMQATKLPVLVSTVAIEPKNVSLVEATVKSSWQSMLDKSWENLQKLVVIRRHQQPVTPLLSQEQQAYLQQNLQLLLQQAQWAVLQRHEVVYQNSLQQAEQWTRLYFVSNTSVTQAMLQAIGELQKINVQPLLPDISNVAQALQQVVASEARSKINPSKSSK